MHTRHTATNDGRTTPGRPKFNDETIVPAGIDPATIINERVAGSPDKALSDYSDDSDDSGGSVSLIQSPNRQNTQPGDDERNRRVSNNQTTIRQNTQPGDVENNGQPQTRKPAGKSVAKPKTGNAEKKKKRKRKPITFKNSTYKVLKQVHPDTSISVRAMSIMESFLKDMFERIATECKTLAQKCKTDGKKTISERDVKAAVKLVLPGELQKHAVSEGAKAWTKYKAASK